MTCIVRVCVLSNAYMCMFSRFLSLSLSMSFSFSLDLSLSLFISLPICVYK